MADDAVKLLKAKNYAVYEKKSLGTPILTYIPYSRNFMQTIPERYNPFVMDVIEPEELSCLKDQFVNLDELKEDVKMKMNVCWRRKDTQIETDPCVIQDVIELPESEYRFFYHHFLIFRFYRWAIRTPVFTKMFKHTLVFVC